VLFMSGVNATGTLAVLPVAVLLIASRLRHRAGRALLGWWLLSTLLACAWWLGPLLLLGRYSPPFLDFIETASATTFPTGWANSLRGADHWVAYFSVNGASWWPGAHTLVTSGILAVVGTGITAVGLVGLVHPRMPLRAPLCLSLVVGLLCLVAGNPSVVGSFVDEPVRALLDGPLAALRNVHKVDPLVRLPVALGFAHGASRAAARTASWLAARSERTHPATGRRVVAGVLAALLAVSAAPLFLNGLRTPGWTEVPQAWTQVSAYLADRPASRALVVPGAGFGLQRWGWTIDEPIQGVASTPWVTRSQVPLVPGPTARVLDAVEQRLAEGQGSAGLAELLARDGITHVVLRRDLDPAVVETAATDRVERALLDSPGLFRVAGFGRTGFGAQPLVEVFAVASAQPRASLVDARDVVTLDGGPEDLLGALDSGALSPSELVIVQSGSAPADLVTDGYARVERQYGRIQDAVGEVMTASAAYRDARRAHDYAGAPTVRTTVADYVGVDGVTASTSQGYPDVFGPVLPEHGPAAALDGRPGTSWRSAPLTPPTAQWLQVDLAGRLPAGVLRVSFGGGAGTATVQTAAVAFDGVPRTYAVPAGGELTVAVPPATARSVRITVESVRSGADAGSPVAVSEVELPGTAVGRTLDVPRPIGPDTTVLLAADAPRRACVDVGYGPACATSRIRGTEGNGLDRRLEVTRGGSWTLSGSVVATAGAATAALLGPVDDATATATSASVYGDDPSVSAVFAFDDDPETPWLAAPGDTAPTLHLGWSGERTVSRLRVDPADVPANLPPHARIESSAGVRDVDLGGLGFFEPLAADGGLSITFDAPAAKTSGAGRPFGVGEIHLDGLEGLQHGPSLASRTGAVCGLGPEVRIDGVVHRTEVTGTLQDVVAGRPLGWRVCDGSVSLGPGSHRVVAGATAQFSPVSLTWRPETGGTAAPVSAGGNPMRITSWGDVRRVVAVTAGPAAILRVAENVNDGWRATLDGRVLEPVVLDGWQQGFRVPAGAGGDVLIEFAPDTWYRGALAVGLALAVVLVGLAVAGFGRRRGALGPPAQLPSPDRRLGRAAGPGITLGAVVLGGVPLAVGWVVGWAVRRRGLVRMLGLGAVLLSGVLLATSPGLSIGRPGPWADGAAALGVGLLLSLVVRRPVR
jgi:arabinofuranan 3-O-arabinosyltransferase